jgi:serine/threonine protein kinase
MTSLAESVSLDDEDEKEGFLDFITQALRWDPRERWTARKLSQHPWLDP